MVGFAIFLQVVDTSAVVTKMSGNQLKDSICKVLVTHA